MHRLICCKFWFGVAMAGNIVFFYLVSFSIRSSCQDVTVFIRRESTLWVRKTCQSCKHFLPFLLRESTLYTVVEPELPRRNSKNFIIISAFRESVSEKFSSEHDGGINLPSPKIRNFSPNFIIRTLAILTSVH